MNHIFKEAAYPSIQIQAHMCLQLLLYKLVWLSFILVTKSNMFNQIELANIKQAVNSSLKTIR